MLKFWLGLVWCWRCGVSLVVGGSFQYVEAAFSFSVFGSWGKIFGEGKTLFSRRILFEFMNSTTEVFNFLLVFSGHPFVSLGCGWVGG